MKLSTNNGNSLDVDNQSSESLSTSIYNQETSVSLARRKKSSLFKESVCPDEWIPRKLEALKGCGTHSHLIERMCGARSVAIHRCKSPLCLFCQRFDMEECLSKYKPVLERFKDPITLVFPVENSKNPETAIEALYNGFEKLKDFRVGKRNLEKWFQWFKEELSKYYVLGMVALINLGLCNEYFVTYLLNSMWRQCRIWKKFESTCLEFMGKGIKNLRLYHLMVGVAKLEVTYSKDFGFHPHFHLVLDGFRIPQLLLSRFWFEVTGSRVVHVQKAYGNWKKELIKYVSKPWELEGITQEDKGTFLWALRNKKKVLISGIKLLGTGNQCVDCGRSKEVCRLHREIPVTMVKKITYKRYMELRKDSTKYLEAELYLEFQTKLQYRIYWDQEKWRLSWIDLDEEQRKEGCSDVYDEVLDFDIQVLNEIPF